MTIKDIIIKYLKDNGFDGLFHPGECACEIDDLIPCSALCEHCESGYKVKCVCGEGCDWDIGRERNKPKWQTCQYLHVSSQTHSCLNDVEPFNCLNDGEPLEWCKECEACKF